MTPPFRRAAFVRAAPFVVFMALLGLRSLAPAEGAWAGLDPRWLYGVQVAVVGGLLAWWWREYGELAGQTWPTLREVLLAVAVGGVVFVLWIRLDAPWMTIGTGAVAPFVPLGADGRLDGSLVVPRLLGATLLVPVMEELFWRSFLMRWIQQPVFEAVAPARVGLKAIVLSTFLFVLAHTLWLAAIVAGLTYAWLYIRTGKLWAAVIAHGVTNGLLGAWVLATGSWQFW
ncbi:MAG: CAAX prenyl protease-related protein [Rubrivivax sp.]|nr:CAAX prenyl protease-related protein [Rubrivivax sp.]